MSRVPHVLSLLGCALMGANAQCSSDSTSPGGGSGGMGGASTGGGAGGGGGSAGVRGLADAGPLPPDPCIAANTCPLGTWISVTPSNAKQLDFGTGPIVGDP